MLLRLGDGGQSPQPRIFNFKGHVSCNFVQEVEVSGVLAAVREFSKFHIISQDTLDQLRKPAEAKLLTSQSLENIVYYSCCEQGVVDFPNWAWLKECSDTAGWKLQQWRKISNELSMFNFKTIKGATTSERLYPREETRRISDIDLLTDKETAAKIYSSCKLRNFKTFDIIDNNLIHVADDREKYISHMMLLHEMPPLERNGFILDINFLVSMQGNDAYRSLFNSEFVEKRFFEHLLAEPAGDIKMSPELDFIYLCVHYSGEIFFQEFETGLHHAICLHKILDVALYIHSGAVTACSIRALVADLGCEYYVSHILEIVCKIFPHEELESFSRDLNLPCINLANYFLKQDGTFGIWKSPIEDRALLTKDKLKSELLPPSQMPTI
jgi:hypothetical protein